ncbi:unnamed protein product [marine sediment metagenome]|uniref:Cell division protein FtsL n=1 Tax=marine sediment metagenome TaxID=412755 RepID=X0RUX7_9ZZZZ
MWIKKENKNHKNKNKNIKKIVNYALFIAIFFVGIFYVVGVNELSMRGFVLYELKNKIYQLEDENNSLELDIMSAQSYENISRRADDLNMIKVGRVDYLSGGGGAVAKK